MQFVVIAVDHVREGVNNINYLGGIFPFVENNWSERLACKYKIILHDVVSSSGGGKVSLASTTWAELAGVHD